MTGTETTDDPAIRVRGLTLRTRAWWDLALDGIDLDVPTGTITGLVGPNGAGKSTLVRCLLGLQRAERGTVRLLGGLRPGSPAAMEATGVVLDETLVPRDWPAHRVGGLLGPFYRDWDEALHRRLLADLRVPTANVTVGQLSRGERMLLGVAVALAHHPRLLVLDEPTSGLDPAARAELADVLRAFVVDPGRSVLFSTHIAADLDRVADRIAVMDAGRLVWQGALEEIAATFAVVRGAGPLPRDAAVVVRGLRERGDHWDGLIRLEDSAAFGPDVVLDEAGVDEVLIALSRGGGLEAVR